LNHEFTIPNVQKLPIEPQAIPIIESRLSEARKAITAGAYLSVIFLCGSVLEGVLLGAAQKEPARFNRASASPKAGDGTVKRFHEWNLAQFIDVACEIDLLKPDVKKLSHGLRDFRNYIHPYEQMVSGFTPDEHGKTLLPSSQSCACKRCGGKKMTTETKSVPSISVSYVCNGSSTKANALGMRPTQERAYEKRGEQYLLIKSPPASGKSRALMFIALDKLQNQGLKQAIIVVPEKAIGTSFQDEPLKQFGFWTDWHVEAKWNLCNRRAGSSESPSARSQ